MRFIEDTLWLFVDKKAATRGLMHLYTAAADGIQHTIIPAVISTMLPPEVRYFSI